MAEGGIDEESLFLINAEGKENLEESIPGTSDVTDQSHDNEKLPQRDTSKIKEKFNTEEPSSAEEPPSTEEPPNTEEPPSTEEPPITEEPPSAKIPLDTDPLNDKKLINIDTIFVIGRTGVGKSTLINSLLGKKVAKETAGCDCSDHDTLERHEGSFRGISVVIYDTRGLGDPELDTKKLMKKLKKKIKEQDCEYSVFICQRLIDRMDDSAERFAKLLADHFKNNYDVWINSIFVLTNANYYHLKDDKIHDTKDGGIDPKKIKMKADIMRWATGFKNLLKKYDVPEEVILNMPICVAGYGDPNLPNITEDWMEDLMDHCTSLQDYQILQSRKRAREASIGMGEKMGRFCGGLIGAIFFQGPGHSAGAEIGGEIGKKIAKREL